MRSTTPSCLTESRPLAERAGSVLARASSASTTPRLSLVRARCRVADPALRGGRRDPGDGATARDSWAPSPGLAHDWGVQIVRQLLREPLDRSGGRPTRARSWLRDFWHECVFDFYAKGNTLEHGSQRFAAYGCHNFGADRRCSRYALRPFVCRAYPALALRERPVVREHCGLRVIDD